MCSLSAALLFTKPRFNPKLGHDLSKFYKGGLEREAFSKLNLKVRRRPGGGGGGRTLKA